MRFLTVLPNISPTKKRDIICGNYVASQWISVFCAFAGTLLSLLNYFNPETRNPENSATYISIFSIAAFAATIAACTAYKFQAKKIGVQHQQEDYDRFKYDYEFAPRNWKSNTGESFYLFSAISLLTVNNYFLFAALQAILAAFKNPNRIYSLLPIDSTLALIWGIKNFAIDLIFNSTNAFYAAAEEIKEDFTGSKAGPLLSWFFKILKLTSPYSYPIVLFWIQSIGVLSHTFTDYIGLLLCVHGFLSLIFSPSWFITLYQAPIAFIPVTGITTVISVLLLLANCIQTLYFEATESQINLELVKTQDTVTPLYPNPIPSENKAGFLHTLISYKPSFTKSLRYGFFSQGFLHACGDTMPVILFIRDLFDRIKSSPFNTEFEIFEWIVVITLAAYVMLWSSYGTHESEVKTAIDHYDEDFADIVDTVPTAECIV